MRKDTEEEVMKFYVSLSERGKNYYKTVNDAYIAAEKHIKKNRGDCVDICIGKGTHRFTSPIEIDGKAFKNNRYSIRFVGEEGAILTSCVDVKGEAFTKEEGKPYFKAQLPESARLADGKFPAFRNIYMNGRQLYLASSGKEYKMHLDSCRRAKQNGLHSDDRLLYVCKESIEGVPVDKDGNVIGELEFWIKTEWQVHCVHIEHIASEPSSIVDDNGEALYAIRVRKYDWDILLPSYYNTLQHYPYWFSNNLSHLKNEGDFYYERETGEIYLIPDEPLMGATVSYPLCERLFYVHDACNVKFENLAMYGVTANYITDHGYITGQGGYIKRIDSETGERVGFLRLAAIYGENVKNIEIVGCNISNVGNDAVNFRLAVDRVMIEGCHFENIGGSAVRLGNINDGAVNRNIRIVNNFIRKTGRCFPSNTGILITSVENLDLSYNTILESYYSAISIGWSWARRAEMDPKEIDTDQFVNIKRANVSHNYIEDFMTGMADGGAIYVLGGNATISYKPYLNSMNNNYIVVKSNVAAGGTAWTVLYHDSGSSHWDDFDNVIVIEEKMRVPACTYISYQLNAHCYSCRTRDLYLVGYPCDRKPEDKYPPDYSDPTNRTFVGWYIDVGRYSSDERLAKFTLNRDARTLAYSTVSTEWSDNEIVVEDVYLYRNFSDPTMTPAIKKKLESIALRSGCDMRHPVPNVQPLPLVKLK